MLIPKYTKNTILKNIKNIKGNSIPFNTKSQLPTNFNIFNSIESTNLINNPDIIIFNEFKKIPKINFKPHTKFYGIFKNKKIEDILKQGFDYNLFWSDCKKYADEIHVIFFLKRKLPSITWDGNMDLSDKTIFVYSEWGFGDIFRNLRFLPILKNIFKKVIFETRSGLKEIISLYKGIEIWDKQSNVPEHDYNIRIENIHNHIQPFFDKIPLENKIKLSKKINIGCVWNSSHLSLFNRNYSKQIFDSLLSEDIECWCFEKPHPEYMKYVNHNLNWHTTACYVNSMNLIITSDTAMAHLAGGLNKDCLVILPENEYPTVITKDTNMWYPSIVIIKNSKNINYQIKKYVDTLQEKN